MSSTELPIAYRLRSNKTTGSSENINLADTGESEILQNKLNLETLAQTVSTFTVKSPILATSSESRILTQGRELSDSTNTSLNLGAIQQNLSGTAKNLGSPNFVHSVINPNSNPRLTIRRNLVDKISQQPSLNQTPVRPLSIIPRTQLSLCADSDIRTSSAQSKHSSTADSSSSTADSSASSSPSPLSNPMRSAAPGRDPFCYGCGSSYHPKSMCPANQVMCHNCSRIGHFASVCRSARRSQ